MAESKEKAKKFYLPEYGICEIQTKSAIEEKAVELIWLYLYVPADKRIQKEFTAEMIQKIMKWKLEELKNAVLASNSEQGTMPGIIEGVPDEIVSLQTWGMEYLDYLELPESHSTV